MDPSLPRGGMVAWDASKDLFCVGTSLMSKSLGSRKLLHTFSFVGSLAVEFGH